MPETQSSGDAAADADAVRVYFDAGLAGRRAQADGGFNAGGPRETLPRMSRETFEGTLTGRRLDQGSPAWRFVELGELTKKPADFEEDRVWVEESYVYPSDGRPA